MVPKMVVAIWSETGVQIRLLKFSKVKSMFKQRSIKLFLLREGNHHWRTGRYSSAHSSLGTRNKATKLKRWFTSHFFDKKVKFAIENRLTISWFFFGHLGSVLKPLRRQFLARMGSKKLHKDANKFDFSVDHMLLILYESKNFVDKFLRALFGLNNHFKRGQLGFSNSG